MPAARTNSASARRSRSAPSGGPAKSSASRATNWSARSTRTPPACVPAIPCAAPAPRCRCGSARVCSAAFSTACCVRSTRPKKLRISRIGFRPLVKAGDTLAPGARIGALPGDGVAQFCLLPPKVGGTVESIVAEGEHAPDATLCTIKDAAGKVHEIGFFQNLADPPAAAGARTPAGRRADGHRPTHPRHFIPRGARRSGRHSRRLRHRQDRVAGDAGEMVRRRRHRLCRLRRARQRNGRSAARISEAQRSAHRPRLDGAHRHHRQYLEHAGGRARGQHLHSGNGRRIFPRSGPACGADGRFDQPLGRSLARSVRPPRRIAGRSRLSGLSRLAARRILRARRAREDAFRQGSARSPSSAPSVRRPAISPSR